LHAVHFRHPDIQQHDIGLEGSNFVDSLPAVLGLSANDGDSITHIIHDGACRSPGRWVIVDKQNSGWYVQFRSLKGRVSEGYPRVGVWGSSSFARV
jgi:hypothetical protein